MKMIILMQVLAGTMCGLNIAMWLTIGTSAFGAITIAFFVVFIIWGVTALTLYRGLR